LIDGGAGEAAMDLDEAVLYRMAYGLAHQLREANVHRGSGRYRSNAAAGGDLETILAEVVKRIHVEGPAGQGLVREAVEDALEGRRPRW
jgi:hypothetical protein